MTQYLLAIDQGTSSSRAMIFSTEGKPLFSHQEEFEQYFPADGWVEHNPEEIVSSVITCCQTVLKKAKLSAKDILAIGISNQRETTILWDKKTGQPIYPAIVWQDRRTTKYCEELQEKKDINAMIQKKTGLLIDPYFSATKLMWLLNHVDRARERAEKGELAFGTVDSYLLWHLTGGQEHATDVTNASRTLLFNIHDQQWDKELCDLFGIPFGILPTVKDNNAKFGKLHESILGAAIPITGMLGDQQAATFGQVCFHEGMIKSTYGTGCFVLLNTGHKIVESNNKLLSTIAYRINGKATYGLEGSIFVAGAAVKWLRDTLRLIHHSADTEAMAKSLQDNGGVYLVPAFTGLGAPYWDPNARGALLGLTRDSRAEHIVRATLEAVCYQTRDLMRALKQDYQSDLSTLRVDGGMVANNWLLQFLTDILNLPVERPHCIETSSLGAAYMAGLGAGIYDSLEQVESLWELEMRFSPKMGTQEREKLYDSWLQAVARVR